RLRKVRKIRDRVSRYGVGAAGMAVIGALCLIFFYLFSEVAPLLRSTSLDITHTYQSSVSSATDSSVHLTLERYQEIGASFNRSGAVNFFHAHSGDLLLATQLPVPGDAMFSALGLGTAADGLVVYGFDNGQVSVANAVYKLSYPNDKRLVTPSLAYPLGKDVVTLDEQGSALDVVAVQQGRNGVFVGAATADNRLLLGVFSSKTNLFGVTSISREIYTLPALPAGAKATHIQINNTGQQFL